MNRSELLVQRRNTLAFINHDPVELVLTPRTLRRTATGGRDWVPGNPRQAQTFRLIPLQDVQPETRTVDGTLLTPRMVLLGTWDASMERGDTFTFKGINYEIASLIRPLHSLEVYQQKGDVVSR